MSSFFGTIFTNGTFPKDGGMRLDSNAAPLSVTSGKVLIICPVCGLSVLKPAAWVRRPGRSNFFCGRACANEFRRASVKVHCVICGKAFFQNPSKIPRVVSCSEECKKERKSRQLLANPIHGVKFGDEARKSE